MYNDLKNEWLLLIRQFSSDEDLNEQLWLDIKNGYSKKNRAYHNLSHIKSMFGELKGFESQINDLPVLQFAIWYHDLVYNAMRKDNEKKSADQACKVMTQLGIPKKRVDRTYHLIMITKSHELDADDDTDAQFMVDFDLEVLSRSWSAYELYTQQIRKEYWMYPSPMYRKGRREAMKHFLNREFIYQTEVYRSEKEAIARANILREIENLN